MDIYDLENYLNKKISFLQRALQKQKLIAPLAFGMLFAGSFVLNMGGVFLGILCGVGAQVVVNFTNKYLYPIKSLNDEYNEQKFEEKKINTLIEIVKNNINKCSVQKPTIDDGSLQALKAQSLIDFHMLNIMLLNYELRIKKYNNLSDENHSKIIFLRDYLSKAIEQINSGVDFKDKQLFSTLIASKIKHINYKRRPTLFLNYDETVVESIGFLVKNAMRLTFDEQMWLKGKGLYSSEESKSVDKSGIKNALIEKLNETMSNFVYIKENEKYCSNFSEVSVQVTSIEHQLKLLVDKVDNMKTVVKEKSVNLFNENLQVLQEIIQQEIDCIEENISKELVIVKKQQQKILNFRK